MSQKTAQALKAENHVKNHIHSTNQSDLGKVYQSLKNKNCECELIYLETSDFDDSLKKVSKNKTIKESLHNNFSIDELSKFSNQGLKGPQSGGWNPQSIKSVFLDTLDDKDLASTVYLLGETFEAILAAKAKELSPYLESLCYVDLFIMEESASWLLHFSRHEKFAFGRK